SRGWVLLVASPQLARKMLLNLQAQGHGQAQLFVGKDWPDSNQNPTVPAAITIDALLADQGIMAESQYVASRVQEQVSRLQQEFGLADDEIIPTPFLWESYGGGALSYQPGTVNVLHIDGHVVAPDPFGPDIDGADPFKTDLVDRLGALGIDVHFADDWALYH